MSGLTQIFSTRSGKDGRFIELVRPHIQLLYRMAYRWTQNRDEAEDLVQDVLLKLLDRGDEMEQLDKLRPWLVKILYRRHVDLHRRQARSPVIRNTWQSDQGLFEELAEDPRNDVHQLEMQQGLLRALESIDDDQRDTILLHDVEGYTALEVAEILGISEGTVKSRLHRARNKLKEFLQTGTF